MLVHEVADGGHFSDETLLSSTFQAFCPVLSKLATKSQQCIRNSLWQLPQLHVV